MYENPHFLVKLLAGSSKKELSESNSPFTGVINPFEKFPTHQPEANEVQVFSCVLRVSLLRW